MCRLKSCELFVVGWETDTNISGKKTQYLLLQEEVYQEEWEKQKKKKGNKKDKDDGKGKGFTCYRNNMGHTDLFRENNVTNKKNCQNNNLLKSVVLFNFNKYVLTVFH